MTHDQSTATASRLFDSGLLTQADSREAARLYLLRKFTRRDKEILSDLVRRYPKALNDRDEPTLGRAEASNPKKESV